MATRPLARQDLEAAAGIARQLETTWRGRALRSILYHHFRLEAMLRKGPYGRAALEKTPLAWDRSRLPLFEVLCRLGSPNPCDCGTSASASPTCRPLRDIVRRHR